MATKEINGKRRRLTHSEYVALILAIVTPVIGIFAGIYLKYDGSDWGWRIVGISILSAIAWAMLIIF